VGVQLKKTYDASRGGGELFLKHREMERGFCCQEEESSLIGRGDDSCKRTSDSEQGSQGNQTYYLKRGCGIMSEDKRMTPRKTGVARGWLEREALGLPCEKRPTGPKQNEEVLGKKCEGETTLHYTPSIHWEERKIWFKDSWRGGSVVSGRLEQRGGRRGLARRRNQLTSGTVCIGEA